MTPTQTRSLATPATAVTSEDQLPKPTLTPPSTPPLRWEKIYEARERLEQGGYQDPEDLEAVADWLDSVFGDNRRVG